jgi:hypothetical protein
MRTIEVRLSTCGPSAYPEPCCCSAPRRTHHNVGGRYPTHHPPLLPRYYHPANLTVAIAGAAEPERVRALAERYFGAWEAPQGAAAVAPSPSDLAREPSARPAAAAAAAGSAILVSGSASAAAAVGAPALDYATSSRAGPLALTGYYRPSLLVPGRSGAALEVGVWLPGCTHLMLRRRLYQHPSTPRCRGTGHSSSLPLEKSQTMEYLHRSRTNAAALSDTHTHTHIHTHTLSHARTHSHARTRTHTCAHTSHTHTRTHFGHTHAFALSTRTHTHILHTHTHTRTHTHTHTCARQRALIYCRLGGVRCSVWRQDGAPDAAGAGGPAARGVGDARLPVPAALRAGCVQHGGLCGASSLH